MKMGTQIMYVPLHIVGELATRPESVLKHPDVEFGFVMTEIGDCHFCRYWIKGHPGELRTVSNSERTPTDLLVEYRSVDQSIVTAAINRILPHDHRI